MSLDEQAVPAPEAGQHTAFPAASWPHISQGVRCAANIQASPPDPQKNGNGRLIAFINTP